MCTLRDVTVTVPFEVEDASACLAAASALALSSGTEEADDMAAVAAVDVARAAVCAARPWDEPAGTTLDDLRCEEGPEGLALVARYLVHDAEALLADGPALLAEAGAPAHGGRSAGALLAEVLTARLSVCGFDAGGARALEAPAGPGDAYEERRLDALFGRTTEAECRVAGLAGGLIATLRLALAAGLPPRAWGPVLRARSRCHREARRLAVLRRRGFLVTEAEAARLEHEVEAALEVEARACAPSGYAASANSAS